MKRICFFSGDITNSGGTERVATIIANNLLKYKVFEVYILSLVEKKDTPFFVLDNQIVHEALYDSPIRGITHIFGIVNRTKKYIRKNNIDVLIDIDGILDMYSIPVKFLTGVKVISWEHFNYFQNPVVPYRKITRKMAARWADLIVVLTNEDKGYYQENLKLKCPVYSIGNPIIYDVNPTEYNSNNKLLLSVGRLTYQKGFDMLVDVAKKVLPKYPDWKWVILGEGEDRDLLESKIKEYQLEDRLVLKGNVSNVSEYYQQAGIFVMTSRFEGLPMTLLETKPYKIPIVSFACKTGPADLIVDSVNGYLIEENNIDSMSEKLVGLMGDRELRIIMSAHANDGMEKFELDYIMKQWVTILADEEVI